MSHSNRQHARARVIAIVPLVLLLGPAAGCKRGNQYVEPPPPPVTVAQPVRRDVIDYSEFPGTTAPYKKQEVRARVQGYLKSIHFQDSTYVRAGALLFVIDPRPFQARLDGARAEVRSKKAVYVTASDTYERNRRSGTGVSKEALIRSKSERDSAFAGIATADAAVENARLDLEFTHVRAAISGLTGRRLIDVGNLVRTDDTLLTTIVQEDPIYAYFNVSESTLLSFMEMQRNGEELPDTTEAPEEPPALAAGLAALSAAPLAPAPLLAAAALHPRVAHVTLYLQLENEKGHPHKGRVDFVDNTVDPGTGTLLVRGVFPNADRVLLPGLNVHIRAPTAVIRKALLVPERALGADQGGRYLLVVNADNVVERRPVTLGPAVDDLRVIREGITDKDEIIVKGLQRARSGSKVNPTRAADTSASAK